MESINPLGAVAGLAVQVLVRDAHAIQLAVAPVFLLTGISALLGVLTNRLSRIINRRRAMRDTVEGSVKFNAEDAPRELEVLLRRVHLINRAISLCTSSALLVCVVIATLFVGAFLKADLSILIGVLFIATMLALVGGLLFFLPEIHLAMDFAAAEMKQ